MFSSDDKQEQIGKFKKNLGFTDIKKCVFIQEQYRKEREEGTKRENEFP